MASNRMPQPALPFNAQAIPQENLRKDKEDYNYAFTNDISGGRNVSGAVQGGIVVLGDYHAAGQLPPTSSSVSSQPNDEDRRKRLETIQSSLRRIYSKCYRSVIQFSAPFFFDVEDKWVNLTIKLENDSTVTEDFATLLQTAFAKGDMLIIEGDPGRNNVKN
uniref:Uncharacterized protein n=1 Tax=Plectus sambesii TaxID=2011161 RepID=A0A914UJA6_9BILA